ncbi:ABC transporter ATP-binding protein [Streptomyces sp. NPDC005438]|uniref:ABC transporter ATP-binding protein n=1 Tax=Streptomyces sp. NPDC005438 TaxID=3156880 RepID=UPI0033ADC470
MLAHANASAPVSAEALRLVEVSKVYGGQGGGNADTAHHSVRALDQVSLSLPTGSFTAIMGPSGSGKSTLLQCAAGLGRPDSGLVMVDGEVTGQGSETELPRFPSQRVGFVFQQYNLLPTLTVAQNTVLPLQLAGQPVNWTRVEEILTQVGLGDRMDQMPVSLSRGERQRVAIARALVTEPQVIIADEPTDTLDSQGAREVMELLREAVDLHGRTVVMVTNDPVAASYADQVRFLSKGRLAGQLPSPTVETVSEWMTRLGGTVRPSQRALAAV